MARVDPFDRPNESSRGVGVANENAVYRDRARRLGLPFVPFFDIGAGMPPDLGGIHAGKFVISNQHPRLAYLAPEEEAMPAVGHWLGRHPSIRSRLRISTPSAIRRAMTAAARDWLGEDAIPASPNVTRGFPHGISSRGIRPR